MMRSKIFPNLRGDFIKWLNADEFIVYIGDIDMIGHKDYWEGDFVCKCNSCKIEMDVRNSDTPACCAWFLENVVVNGKDVKDCPVYEPVED